MKKTPVLIITAVVAVIVIVAVIASMSGQKSSSSTQTNNNTAPSMSASSSNAVAADKVDINNFMFGPADIKVKVGTTVTWTNHDTVRHNVVSDDGMMPDGKLIAKDETYSYTFTKAGTYKYHCSPHPYMHGSVTVE